MEISAIRIWWMHYWRTLIALIIAISFGIGVGGVLGFALGRYGASANIAAFAFIPIGLALGLFLSVVPMKMAFGKVVPYQTASNLQGVRS
jgi:hypothetical protein